MERTFNGFTDLHPTTGNINSNKKRSYTGAPGENDIFFVEREDRLNKNVINCSGPLSLVDPSRNVSSIAVGATKPELPKKECLFGRIFPRRPASLPARVEGRKVRRKASHRDAEEALNSLLWQPYEYQAQRNNISDNSSLFSRSYTSCSSLSSFDLEECPNNNGRSGNAAADLHLSEDMVNNLSEAEKRFGQWDGRSRSRESLELVEASRLNANTSSCCACVELLTRPSDDIIKEKCPNGFPCKFSDMQVEVPSVVQVNAANGHPSRPPLVDINYNTQHNYLSTINNLGAANVVGLPNHPRQLSVPNKSTTGNGFVFPNHARNSSEPATLMQQTPFRPIQKETTRSSSVPRPDPIKPLNNVNVNVNCYRAVPVNVISSVPTIQCLNSNSDLGNNVSNVQIMPLSGTTTISLSTSNQIAVQTTPKPSPRTFTSTEAQTDDTPTQTIASLRENRRRERRERRRRAIASRHENISAERTLPDILNSHLPPPYTPGAGQGNLLPPAPPPLPPGGLVQPMVQNIVPSAILQFPGPVSGQVPLVQRSVAPGVLNGGIRFGYPGTVMRDRFVEERPKGCCGLLVWKPGSLRWFIVLIALVGVCCVLVGTALGAMRPAGRDHLTVSLLMIGVGISLVTVSGIAWRLTSHDTSTCRSLWGLSGSTESMDVCGTGALTSGGGTRRFMPRLPPSYGRPHHPYAAMMYPEFQYRPPPPSYQASMQEYRLRLLLLDRGNSPQIQVAGLQNAVSPPPTYRSHSGSLLRASLTNRRDATQSEYSCPPSYRSQTSSARHAALHNSANNPHSREQSVSLSESNCADSVVNVVSIFNGTTEDEIVLDNLTIESLKLEPDTEINSLNRLSSGKGSSCDLDEGNLVTIVQTSDQSPVIVTVSGNSRAHSGNSLHITEIPTEMEILAHL